MRLGAKRSELGPRGWVVAVGAPCRFSNLRSKWRSTQHLRPRPRREDRFLAHRGSSVRHTPSSQVRHCSAPLQDQRDQPQAPALGGWRQWSITAASPASLRGQTSIRPSAPSRSSVVRSVRRTEKRPPLSAPFAAPRVGRAGGLLECSTQARARRETRSIGLQGVSTRGINPKREGRAVRAVRSSSWCTHPRSSSTRPIAHTWRRWPLPVAPGTSAPPSLSAALRHPHASSGWIQPPAMRSHDPFNPVRCWGPVGESTAAPFGAWRVDIRSLNWGFGPREMISSG